MANIASAILNRLLGSNKANDQNFLRVDPQRSVTTFTNEYSSSQSDTAIISPSSGNKIVVEYVFIHANGNVGEIDLDFDGGDKIGKLYSSQNTRLSMNNLTKEGDVDQDVLLNGGGDSFFIAVGYIEE